MSEDVSQATLVTGPAVFAQDGSHTHTIPSVVTPTPAPVPSPVPVSIPTLPALTAIGTGAQAQAWAAGILALMGAPNNQATVNSLVGWFAMEDNHATSFGQHADGAGQNNPLNVTADSGTFPGVTGSEPSGAGPSHPGNLNFDTPADGIAATVQVISHYPVIYQALMSGLGLLGSAASSVAGNLSTWSGGGYSSINWPVG